MVPFFRLALPMIVSRAGLAVMGIADGIMVSRFRPLEFAWLSLAEGTLGRLLDLFVAFLIGGLLLAPRHFAQGDKEGAWLIWRRTLPAAVALGLLGGLAGLFGAPLLTLIGQQRLLAGGAGPIMVILGAGYPAALAAVASAVYLEGIQRPQVVAICVIGANVLNLALNWLLIGGHFGLAAMGARGSALSTTLMRCALAVVLVSTAWRARTRTGPAVGGETVNAERAASRRAQWRLSFGSAASVAAMIVLSSSLVFFAGRLGVLPLAAFSAAWGLGAPAILLMLGMADAAGVMVAAEGGRGSLRSVASVAWSSLGVTVLVTGAIAIALATFANAGAALYAKDLLLRHSIAAVLPIVALVLILDSIGSVMASSLRAIREAAWPAIIEVAAMLLLVPTAAALAIWQSFGVRGLFLAMLTAASARAAMLTLRFYWRVRRHTPAPDSTLESLCQKI